MLRKPRCATRVPSSTLPPRPATHGQRTLKKQAALPSAPTPCIAHAPSGAATSTIHSTTSSARNPFDIRAASVDHRQRERPQPLERPIFQQPLNPPRERWKAKCSFRPLNPPFRQVSKSYASVTTSASVKTLSRPRNHRTCPHVLFEPRAAPADRTYDEDVTTSRNLVRWSDGPVRFSL